MDGLESKHRAALQQFRYQPLSQDREEIRVLVVQPSRFETAPLSCKIVHCFLDQTPTPEYETISYVWGNPNMRARIGLNRCGFDVTASAERVLRRMRHPDRSRTLWIDAVCINQWDTVERNSQVALMAKIYSNTALNLIWLGEGDRYTIRALNAIHDVLGDARKETNDLQDLRSAVYHAGNTTFQSSYAPIQIDLDFEGLLYLYRSVWFTRLWAVQEAALPRKSICLLGSSSVVLLDVLRAACWLQYKQRSLPFRLSGERGVGNAFKMWLHVDKESSPWTNGTSRYPPGWQLQVLFESMQDFSASDPRDLIYGALGLYQKMMSNNRIPELLAPDYRKCVSDVFTDATVCIITESRNLDIFHRIHSRDDKESSEGVVPSWVPQFDLPWKAESHPTALSSSFAAYGNRHKSSLLRQLPGQADRDTSVLSVRGIICDLIDNEEFWSVSRETSATEYIKIIGEINARVASVNGASECSLETVACTLTCGVDADRQCIAKEDALSSYHAWLTYLESNRRFPPLSNDAWSRQSLHNTVISKYDYGVCNGTSIRLLFSTTGGRLGAGPKLLQPGDLVAILWGCRWPVVLRKLPAEDEHTLVGLAYVHGIMFGEAVHKLEEEGKLDSETRWFHLR